MVSIDALDNKHGAQRNVSDGLHPVIDVTRHDLIGYSDFTLVKSSPTSDCLFSVRRLAGVNSHAAVT